MKRSATTQSTTSTTTIPAKRRAIYRKQRSKRTAQVNLTRSSFVKWGFPTRLYVKHKYSENIAVTSSAGALATYLFRANGMFDPNRTGTGHQPMYYDNCAAIYNHWTVIKSYARVHVCPITETTTAPYAFATFLDDDSTPPATMGACQEQGTSSFTLVAPASNQTQTQYIYFDARKIFGGNPLSNDNLQGNSAGSDPTEESYFVTALQALNASTQTFNLSIEIVYFAIWDELKSQNEN